MNKPAMDAALIIEYVNRQTSKLITSYFNIMGYTHD